MNEQIKGELVETPIVKEMLDNDFQAAVTHSEIARRDGYWEGFVVGGAVGAWSIVLLLVALSWLLR